ncbi:MAG TPA: SCP2 sterol-binding domain-containing protein, partial [Candidatus Kurthia intestinigallinarum]|nr:SCP2 sterol-binding domain-containing protein [Candidatus Kurthia intestinigallinarum]
VMISTDIFKQLTMGQLNPQTAFLMGKLTAKGDMRHITRLSSILTYYS